MFRWIGGPALRFSALATLGGLLALVTSCGGLFSDGGCAAADCDEAPAGGTSGAGARAGRSGGGMAGKGGGFAGAPSGETGGTGAGGGTLGGSSGKGGGGGTLGGSSGKAGDACEQPSDCVLVDRTCCGKCQPTEADLLALNQEGANDFVGERPCTDVLCQDCSSDPESTRAWFGVTCESGQCAVLDLRATSMTECAVSNDCVLRNGANCCERCEGSADTVISLNEDADLEALVCDGESACPPCVPTPPDGFEPSCVEGRCKTMLPTR